MEQRTAKVGGVITLEPAWQLPPLAVGTPGTRADWLRVGRAVAVGLLLTLAQVALACLLTGKKDPRQGYLQLWMWDGAWYASVAAHGYTPPPQGPGAQGNTSFFPGYPLAARGLMDLFGLAVQPALLLAAQLAAWGFWTCVLLFCQRWGTPAALTAVGVLLIFVHPASFFLVAAYSESLFLLGVVGVLYWSAVPRWSAGLLAGTLGVVMTASRLVGVPLVVLPLLHAAADRGAAAGGRLRSYSRALLACALAGLGAGLFFAYCHFEFGHWDQYVRSSAQGWGARADYLGLFTAGLFQIGRPNWHEVAVDANFLSRLAVPVTVLAFGGFFLAEVWLARRHADGGWRVRLGFYVAAFVIFYVSASGNAGRNMTSMIRYSQCSWALLVLALVHLLGRAWPLTGWRDRLLTVGVTAWAVVGFGLQVLLTYRFVRGMWVA